MLYFPGSRSEVRSLLVDFLAARSWDVDRVDAPPPVLFLDACEIVIAVSVRSDVIEVRVIENGPGVEGDPHREVNWCSVPWLSLTPSLSEEVRLQVLIGALWTLACQSEDALVAI